MRVVFFFACIFAVASASSLYAAEKPQPAQTRQSQTKKVWTNDDMDDLRARGLISIFNPEVPQAAVQVTPAQPALAPPPQPSALPVYNPRLEDPEWYSRKAADLRAELDKRQALIRAQQAALALAQRGITQPGLAMDQPSFGITPQAAMDNLEAQVREVQSQLDELSDLARINDISPGVLRG